MGHQGGSLGESDSPAPTLIAGRYRLEASIGRGGMGEVFRCWDQNQRRAIALKRLRTDAQGRQAALCALFEREFHALRELSHPSIIEVYDYGMDADGAFYTMELCDGNDVSRLSPLPWREACKVLRDIASSLAIIHSRRLLHRDVSPGNVRYGEGGRAKLLDFGALSTIGVSGQVIGTPPCIPPEALNGQVLDARADLYSLGALGYYLLMGRHAYPARNVQSLRDAWRSRPTPLRDRVRDAPPGLIALITSLLSPDPLARPASAAEVVDRVSAVAGLESDDSVEAAQAYLVTPTLVGRDDQVVRFRRQVLRAGRGRGSSLIVEGPAGVGRSRLLRTFELEGKLAGATVLRASARRSDREDYDLVRMLVDDLLAEIPDVALEAAQPYADALGEAVPRLREALGSHESLDAVERKQIAAQSQHVIVRWLEDVSRSRALVIVLDDAHEADEASLLVVSALARSAPRRRLALVATVSSESDGSRTASLNALRRLAPVMPLEPLTAEESGSLVRSLFGEVPHVARVADWIYRLSRGNPQIAMELAQHLVDQAMARYEHGGWVLPASLREEDLPASFEDTLDRRIEGLSEGALALAQALASSEVPLSIDEYAELLDGEGSAGLFAAVGELVAAGILVAQGDAYELSQQGYVEALRRTIDAPTRVAVERRLVQVFAGRGDLARQAAHLLRAGDELEALDVLMAYYEQVGAALGFVSAPGGRTGIPSYFAEDTTAAIRIRQALLEVCERHGRPEREKFVIRSGIMSLANMYDLSMMRGYAERQIAQLRHDTGVIYWDELSEIEDGAERLKRCLAKARQVYDATPEAERVLSPRDATGASILTLGIAQGMGRQGFDVPVLRELTAFSEKLSVLDSRFAAVHAAAVHSLELACGREEKAAELRRGLLAHYDRVTPPDRPMHPITHAGRCIVLHCEGFYRASEGGSQAAAWADLLEKTGEQLTGLGADSLQYIWGRRAWEIRRLMHLFQGDSRGARKCQERIDQFSIRHAYAAYGGGGTLLEARAYALSGDLMGLKQSVELITDIVEQQYPGWRPCLHLVKGQYYGLRGEPELGLSELERAIAMTGAGEHIAWALATAARIELLVRLERAAEARDFADECLKAARASELGRRAERDLEQALAVAEASGGDCVAGAARLERLIAEAEDAGMDGVPLGALYEARARIAVLAGDAPGFEHWATRTGERYRAGGSPALAAKHERLIEAGRTAGLMEEDRARRASASPSMAPGNTEALWDDDVEDASDAERSSRALRIMLQRSGATDGFLFLLRNRRLLLTASQSVTSPPPELVEALQEYVEGELDDTADVTITCFDMQLARGEAPGWPAAGGGSYRPVLLASHHDGGRRIVGIAALLDTQNTFATPSFEIISSISDGLIHSEGEVVSVFEVG